LGELPLAAGGFDGNSGFLEVYKGVSETGRKLDNCRDWSAGLLLSSLFRKLFGDPAYKLNYASDWPRTPEEREKAIMAAFGTFLSGSILGHSCRGQDGDVTHRAICEGTLTDPG
jgi:hypothetical protein